jgi:hypothetical protein
MMNTRIIMNVNSGKSNCSLFQNTK